MARICLVSSSMHSNGRRGMHGCNYYQAPLNLCILAASLLQMGHEVQIVDPGPLELDPSQTVQKIVSFKPEFVGFSSVTPFVCESAHIASQCKQRGMTTIVGGSHVTAEPIKTMERFPCFDYALLGETDVTLPELIRELRAGRGRPKDIEGLVYRAGGQLVEISRGPFLRNLDALPMPAVDLLPDISLYYQPKQSIGHSLPVFTIVPSRGCNMTCMLCDRVMFGRQKRSHGPYYIYRLIQHLTHNYGIRHILIKDHTFLFEKDSLLILCRLLADGDLNVTWSCFTRADAVDPELLPEIKRAGCTRIVIGQHPCAQSVIEQMNMSFSADQILQAVQLSKAHGFVVRGEFFVGGFGETEETIEESARLVRELPLDDFSLSMFRPLPGSEAYEIASQFGTFQGDWERCVRDYFVPNGLSAEGLMQAYWKVFRAFFLKPRTVFMPFGNGAARLENLRKVSKAGLSILCCPRVLEDGE